MRRTKRLSAILPVFFLALATACGGGGGNGPSGNVTAMFTGDAPGDVSMASGGATNANFAIDIDVDGIANFFGAAFTVTYTGTTAEFTGTTTTGSVFADAGVDATAFDISASELVDGQVTVSSTLVGQGYCNAASGNAGMMCASDGQCTSGGSCLGGIPSATGRLVRLNFTAQSATSGNTFAFLAGGGSRQVQICPTAGGACTDAAGTLTFTGGTLTAN